MTLKLERETNTSSTGLLNEPVPIPLVSVCATSRDDLITKNSQHASTDAATIGRTVRDETQPRSPLSPNGRSHDQWPSPPPTPSLTLLSPSFAMPFTKIFKDVQAHGNTVLTVVYTNDVDTVEAYINDYKDILQGRKEKIVGIDVEYTRDKKRPALIQLSIGKDDTVLLFQVCATFEQRCPAFDKFLANPK